MNDKRQNDSQMQHPHHTLRPVAIAVVTAIGVSGLLVGCGGGSNHHHGGGGGGGATQSLVTSGGAGGTATGSGGNGGSVYLYAAAADTVIEILTGTSGAPDVGNPDVQSNLGDNGWTVDSDITVPIDPENPATLEYYQVAGDCRIYKANSTDAPDDDTIVSGVEVADGVTLTLQDNAGANGCIEVSNDIVNDGTIKTMVRGTDPVLNGGVSLAANNYIGVGAITTSGACGEGLNPDGQVIEIDAQTAIYNAGDLSTAGADCDPGGHGGNIGLYVAAPIVVAAVPAALVPPPVTNLWNGGTLDASGGTSTAEDQQGGSGGDVSLNIDVVSTSADQNGGRLISAGAIDTSGGDGVAGGGAGGAFYANLYGPAANGDGIEASNIFILAGIDTHGGAVTGANGSGGTAGDITMAIQAGGGSLELLGFGQITTSGGDGAEGGGDGGYVYLYSYGNDADYTNQADIDTSGGNATVLGSGGSGGYIELYNDGGSGSINNSGDLTANGGSGVSGGGDGGDIYLYMYDSVTASITNSGKLTSRGGDHTGDNPAEFAGDGGYIEVEIDGSDAGATGTVSNTGAIDTTGGNSTHGIAGTGGDAEVEFEHAAPDPGNSVSNTASITTNGGVGGVDGGDGGWVDMYSPGVVTTNSGSISTQGGAGDAGNGGSGGSVVYMYGEPFTNEGNINASGGNGGIDGGDGADINLQSTGDTHTANSGTLTSAGGIGETGDDGTPGTITIDGVEQ